MLYLQVRLKTLNGGMIENYTNGGMARESPLYDFQIIFNAILCKMTPRIRFSTYFWPPDKIDGIMAVFSLKKLT